MTHFLATLIEVQFFLTFAVCCAFDFRDYRKPRPWLAMCTAFVTSAVTLLVLR